MWRQPSNLPTVRRAMLDLLPRLQGKPPFQFTFGCGRSANGAVILSGVEGSLWALRLRRGRGLERLYARGCVSVIGVLRLRDWFTS